jgi:TPR repeat protein
MFQLGNMYAKGVGVPKDRAEALKWFDKAARLGIADARRRISELKGEG